MGLRKLQSTSSTLGRAELGRAGLSRRQVDVLVQNGQLQRVRRGSYVADARFLPDDGYARHRLMAHDLARSAGGAAVVSHISAAVLLGLMIPPGIDLDAVHLTWPGATGRGRTANVRPHRAMIDDDDLTSIDGIAVTGVARTVYDLARTEDQLVSVSVADAALAGNACTAGDFEAVLERTRGRRGSVMAWQVMTFADGRAATDLHSKVRVLFARMGLPFPELATTIAAPDPVGPIDFEFGAWRTAAMIASAAGPSQGLDELERALLTVGWSVCRITESDLAAPAQLFQRISTALNSTAFGSTAVGGNTGARWSRRPAMLVGAPKSIWHY